MAATAVVTLETVSTELQAKTNEVQQLQTRLQQAQALVNELRSAQHELEIAIATEQPGATDRLHNLLIELQVATGRASGLQLLIGTLQPQIERLQEQWSQLKRVELQQARAKDIAACEEEVLRIDDQIHEHNAQIERLVAQRQAVQDRKNQLQRS